MAKLDVSLAPPQIGEIGSFAITNAMISAFATSAVLIIFAIILRRKLSLVPGRLQMFFEMLIGMLYDKMVMAFGSEKRARKAFPLIFTIFLFLIVGNYFTFLPFIETIKTDGGSGTSIFTTPTAHYSLTITLGLTMILAAHVVGLVMAPFNHINNFIKFKPFFKAIWHRRFKELPMAFIELFLGLLDIIGEIAKVISISTRLFGNMFAGGVIIMIVSSLAFATQFLVPLPFMVLGTITGIVQAFVFAMLGTLFMSGTINAAKPVEETEAKQAEI